MHSKTYKTKIMGSDEADEFILRNQKLFDSLKNGYQDNLESMRGSELVFNCVQLLYYKCHKTIFSRGGSYIDCPDWIKNKNAAINPINK